MTLMRYRQTDYETDLRWRGDHASYAAKHMWIYKRMGKALICSNDPSHSPKRFEWSNISGEYKRSLSDWRQLCPSCHRKNDYEKMYGNKCRRGHPFEGVNVRYRLNGKWRTCVTCYNDSQKRFRDRRKNDS